MHHRSPGGGSTDTPLLRVSRPVSACSRCRAAKIKCDGKLPACTACEKSGRAGECSSANDQFAKGKERSYVASLESRIERLERKIAYARSRKASVAMHDADEPDEGPDRKDSLASIRAAIHGKAARRREVADVNELVSDFGFLSVNATTRDFEPSTSNMTFARLILAASNNEAVPKPKPFQMPQRSDVMLLIQDYLDNVFVLFPVFSETALFNALDAVYQVNGRSVTEFEYWLLYMVLAIASASRSRSSNDAYSTAGLAWAGRALRYADKVLMPGYVSQIQALILLVQYSMLDPAHFDSWQLIGFACRAIVDLGFHQDPPKEEHPDKKILEMRRKLFYCVYSLDRSISMVHARAFSFTDDSVSVAYPSAAGPLPSVSTGSSLTQPHSLETALLLFQLRRGQSSWYQQLFQSTREPLQEASTYVWQMCQDMHEWAESFPETLPPIFKDFFDLELLYSYVYCIAPSCRVQSVPDYGKTLIFEYSISYMQKILPISREPTNHAFYTYHDALRVYFIGSQFLAVLTESFDQLLNGIIRYIPFAPGSPPPPPLPINTGIHNVDRSMTCIAQIKETLRTFGHRWDDAQALQSSFEAQAGPLLASLHQRKHGMATNSQSPPDLMQQPIYNQMGNMVTNNWSNMGPIFVNPNTSQGGPGGSVNALL